MHCEYIDCFVLFSVGGGGIVSLENVFLMGSLPVKSATLSQPRGPMTLTPVAERLAVELSLPILAT